MLALLAGCATTPPPRVYASPSELRAELEGDRHTLSAVRAHLDALDDEFVELRSQGRWSERGYFSAAENDRTEDLLFRFVTSHSALWDVSAAYQDMQMLFDDPQLDAEAHVVSRQASLLLASHSSHLVAAFADDDMAIDKLNEAFYRSDIPRDSYSRLAETITSGRLSRLVRAGAHVDAELDDPGSELARLAVLDARYGELIAINQDLQTVAEARMRTALDTREVVAPDALRDTGEFFGEGLYAVRAMLFKGVSRLKNPTAHLVSFSDEQKRQVAALLHPADLVITYTAGYASDVFIPGAFKHGITYVGSPEQRAQAGLTAEAPVGVAPDARHRFVTDIARAKLGNGRPADVIEAVAEGVIFNELAHLMDTHINRMLVLRPLLTDAERTDYLVEVFSYLGEEYDFRFDFADSTRQVCTEVIYRAMQGKGGIAFDLTERGGHETLSADDIVLYFLGGQPPAFELVLYADEDPDGEDHAARILTGDAGLAQLKQLLAEVGESPAPGG